MNKLVGLLILAVAVAFVLLGSAGIFTVVTNVSSEGIGQQHVPREAFKLAFYSIFLLIGFKLALFGRKKVTR